MSNDQDDEPRFPLYVRILAVAYVLSLIAGPAGFVVLATLAGIRSVRHGFDQVVAECLIAAIGCPIVCAAYRTWFCSWGRANWPDGKPDRF